MKIFVVLSLALVSCGAVPTPTMTGMHMASMGHGKNKMPMGGMGMNMGMGMGMKNKRENQDELLKLIPADLVEGVPVADLLGKPTGPENKPAPVTEEKPEVKPADKPTEKPEAKPESGTTPTPAPVTEGPEIKSNVKPKPEGKDSAPKAPVVDAEKKTPSADSTAPHTRETSEDSHLPDPTPKVPVEDGKKPEVVDMTPIPIPVSEVSKPAPKPVTNGHSHHHEKPAMEGGHGHKDDDDDDDDEKDCNDKDHHHYKKPHKTSHHKKIKQEKEKFDDKPPTEDLPHVESSSLIPVDTPTTQNPHRIEATHHKVRATVGIPPVDPKGVTKTQQEEAEKALREQGVREERNFQMSGGHGQGHHSHHGSSHHQHNSHHQGDNFRQGMGHSHGNKGHMMHRRSADGYGSSTATRSSSSDYSDSAPVAVRSSGYGSTRTVVRETSEYSAPATRTVTRSSGYSSGTRSRSATRSSSGYGRAVRAEMGYGHSTPSLDEVVEEYHEAPVAPTVVRTVTTTYDQVVPAVREAVEEYSAPAAPAVREISEEYSAPAPAVREVAPVVSVRRSPLKFAVRHRSVVTRSGGYDAPTRVAKSSMYDEADEPAPLPVTVVADETYNEQPTRIVKTRTVPVVRESNGYASSSPSIRISADRYKRSADGSGMGMGMVSMSGGSKTSHFPKGMGMGMAKHDMPMNKQMHNKMPMTMN